MRIAGSFGPQLQALQQIGQQAVDGRDEAGHGLGAVLELRQVGQLLVDVDARQRGA
jgi:hypothetical protein